MAKGIIEYYYVMINGDRCVFNDAGRISMLVKQADFEKLLDAHADCGIDGKCLGRFDAPIWGTKSYDGELRTPARVCVNTLEYRTKPCLAGCQCDVKTADRASCAKMLADGKCTDARVRATLGTVLYPHLYAQKTK